MSTFIYFGDKDSFAYHSSIGRIFESGDKVLNTRTAMYELEQIKLFERVIEEKKIDFYTGIGWDIPGSGGSYRVWFLGLGLFGFIIWFFSFYKILLKSNFFNKSTFLILIRLFILILFFYTHGNWFKLLTLIPIIF